MKPSLATTNKMHDKNSADKKLTASRSLLKKKRKEKKTQGIHACCRKCQSVLCPSDSEQEMSQRKGSVQEQNNKSVGISLYSATADSRKSVLKYITVI